MKSLNDYIIEKLVINKNYKITKPFLAETTWERGGMTYNRGYISYDAEKPINDMFNDILKNKKSITRGHHDIKLIKFPMIFSWNVGDHFIYSVIGEENGEVKFHDFNIDDHISVYFVNMEDAFKNKSIDYIYDKLGNIGCYLINDSEYNIIVNEVEYIKDFIENLK